MKTSTSTLLILVFSLSKLIAQPARPLNVAFVSESEFSSNLNCLKDTAKSSFEVISNYLPGEIDSLDIIRSFAMGMCPAYPSSEVFSATIWYGEKSDLFPRRDVFLKVQEYEEWMLGGHYLIHSGGDLFMNYHQYFNRYEIVKENGWDPLEDRYLQEENNKPKIMSDTVFNSDAFLMYLVEQDSISIVWGTKSFSKTLPIKFSYSDFGVELPRLQVYTGNYIVLDFGCGTSCWASYILPLSWADSVQLVWYPLVLNQESNTIAHLDESERDRVILTQLDSRRMRILELNEKCKIESVGACVESVRLSNDELSIQYADWMNEPPISLYLNK